MTAPLHAGTDLVTARKRMLLLIGLAWLAVSGWGCGEASALGDGGSDGGPDAGSAFAKEILAAHNEVRANAQPAPQPPLPPLTWNAQAAAVAQNWANQCQFAHNPGRGNHGENLAAAAPPGSKTPTGVVQGWANEAGNYNYTSNTCASGKVCGHYTQLVWRSTTSVGCATQVCSTNSPFGSNFPNWQIWVCDYSPPGNYLGQKPY